MPKANRCPRCGNHVKAENLPDHLRKAHGDAAAAEAAAKELRRSAPKSAARRTGRRLPLGPMAVATVGIVIVLVILVLAMSLTPSTAYTSSTPVTQMCDEAYPGLARHDHAQLTITIQGAPYAIPGNIGIQPGCTRPVHTHNAGGEIHIESPVPHAFTLGDFFTVWGKPFSSSEILSYSTDGGHTITMTVNGTTNTEYQNLVLEDGQQIVITFN